MIPPRPKYPLKTNSSEKAVQDYQSQIKSIVDTILDDYRNLSLDELDPSTMDPDSNKSENEYEIK